jgi:hypothetical protein
MFNPPHWLTGAFDLLDSDPESFPEHRVIDAVHRARRAAAVPDEDMGEAALAELAAFMVMQPRTEEGRVWPIHFQPSMTMPTGNPGEVSVSPDLRRGGRQRWDYWRYRSTTARHPVLRARYADLCWDTAGFLAGLQRSPEDARAAVSAYLESARADKPSLSLAADERLARALELATMLNDQPLQAQVVAGFFDRLHRTHVVGRVGTWCFTFDELLPGRGGPKLTPDQESHLIALAEVELSSLKPDDPVAVHSVRGAADRLSAYYDRKARTSDQKRVLRAAAESFEALADSDGSDMQRLSWLESAHEYYTRAGERPGYERVLITMREAGLRVQAQMQPVTVETATDRSKIDAYVRAMTGRTLEEGLENFAVRFIPVREELVAQIKDLQARFISESLFGQRAILQDGHVVACIGTYDTDPDGKVAHFTSQHVGLTTPFRAMVLDSIVKAYNPSAVQLLTWLRQSPVYTDERASLINAGLEAYLAGDFVKSIHVLIPQIERALLELAALRGRPTRKPAVRGGSGAFHVRNLNDLLSDPEIEAALGPDLHSYLDSVLANSKGMNLRNRVCHGLCPPHSFTRPWADLILHCTFAVSLVRRVDTGPAPDGGAIEEVG